MRILITGAAGFIGAHAVQRFGEEHDIIGIDNLNDYYDPKLKIDRLAALGNGRNIEFCNADLADSAAIHRIFESNAVDVVLHLGAQAGVRYSISNPHEYAQSNLLGTLNVLEACRKHSVSHLIYASSSSVYGANTKLPFSVEDKTDSPVSLYAATKKATELMCHSYSHLYRIPATGLRFFTVYGPWGRPDMAYFKFARSILEGREIDIYNYGNMRRDFTYIDDIIDGVELILSSDYKDPVTAVPHRVFNLGHNKPESLLEMVEIIERLIGRTAKKNFLPMQPGDVHETYADIQPLQDEYGFSPKISLETGLQRFVEWYEIYYKAR